MSVELREITREELTKSYPATAATTIFNQIQEFLPYESNFPSFRSYFAEGRERSSKVLVIEVVLRVRDNTPGGGIQGGHPDGEDVRVALSFPPQYPDQVVQVQLLLPAQPSGQRLRIKTPYPVMSSAGMIQVECLNMLRGVERPFPLIDVLLALSEQFDVEFPYASEATVQRHQQQQTAQSSSAAMANVLTTTSQNPQRTSLIQEAAEKVVIDLNSKAGNYLETREQALFYLQRLNESNRELTKSRDILTKHKRELEEYLPKVGDVSTLAKKLEAIPNTIDEHSRCLVAKSETQERALALVAEIHATEDMLSLLEDGLKNDYFDVDEYVKCVSDVGRDQFIARLLCQRALAELNKGKVDSPIDVVTGSGANSNTPSPGPHAAPSIPQRISGSEALQREFSQADPDVIRDVLQNVNGDVTVARQQLRAMYS